MEPLNRQRCLHHPERQAVARCPECARFFCRECIAEHDDRVLCAGCLKKLAASQTSPKLGPLTWRMLLQGIQMTLGVFVIWLFFYFCGWTLLAIPTKFHDGTVWNIDVDGGDEE